MFRNIRAEQARIGMTNEEMAKALGISRPTYENKKRTGKFTASEAAALCKLFNVSFDYLFSTDQAI